MNKAQKKLNRLLDKRTALQATIIDLNAEIYNAKVALEEEKERNARVNFLATLERV